MATPIAGTSGFVKIAGTPEITVGEIKQWDLTILREVADASTLGVTFRKRVATIGDWNGKLTGFYSVSTDTGQTLINNAVLQGLELSLELINATDKYEGQAIPSQVDVSNPVDGIVTFDVTFQGDGPLSFS